MYLHLGLKKRNEIHELNQRTEKARSRFVCIDKTYLTEPALQMAKERSVVVLKTCPQTLILFPSRGRD